MFDTICGATQERQDALFDMLRKPMDVLFVVGGYNSSNTTHLVEIGEQSLPTFFIRNADCIESAATIRHFDIHAKKEIESTNWLPAKEHLTLGITAGASCPNNLIEEAIKKVLGFREAQVGGSISEKVPSA
jgi:4-hydroxy-3-methylbut-2-enyl diphosphate reductase